MHFVHRNSPINLSGETPFPRGTVRLESPLSNLTQAFCMYKDSCDSWGFCGKHMLGKTRRNRQHTSKMQTTETVFRQQFPRKNANLFPLFSLSTFKASESWLIAHNNSEIQQSYWMTVLWHLFDVFGKVSLRVSTNINVTRGNSESTWNYCLHVT